MSNRRYKAESVYIQHGREIYAQIVLDQRKRRIRRFLLTAATLLGFGVISSLATTTSAPHGPKEGPQQMTPRDPIDRLGGGCLDIPHMQ